MYKSRMLAAIAIALLFAACGQQAASITPTGKPTVASPPLTTSPLLTPTPSTVQKVNISAGAAIVSSLGQRNLLPSKAVLLIGSGF